MEQTIAARLPEAFRLAHEHMELLETIGDPTFLVGLSFPAIVLKHETGEPRDMLRWSQRIIDLAAGDPAKGNLILGSPLAMALAWRGVARRPSAVAGGAKISTKPRPSHAEPTLCLTPPSSPTSTRSR